MSATGPILQFGSTDPDVASLQAALAVSGFPPGVQDGSFGVGTESAVMAFQKSIGLLPDGVVGPRTRSVLAARRSAIAAAASAAAAIAAGDVTGAVTVQIVARMLPGALLPNIARNLPKVLDALRARALSDRVMVLVALATIRAETAGFVPLDEGISRYNTSPNGSPFDLYDFRRDMGNGAKGDGARFKGRGFVQLTGRANYHRIGAVQKLPLETQPETANDPDTAARVLAEFLKPVEQRIKQAVAQRDLADARRAVNGGLNGLPDFEDAYRIGDGLLSA